MVITSKSCDNLINIHIIASNETTLRGAYNIFDFLGDFFSFPGISDLNDCQMFWKLPGILNDLNIVLQDQRNSVTAVKTVMSRFSLILL